MQSIIKFIFNYIKVIVALSITKFIFKYIKVIVAPSIIVNSFLWKSFGNNHNYLDFGQIYLESCQVYSNI